MCTCVYVNDTGVCGRMVKALDPRSRGMGFDFSQSRSSCAKALDKL